MLANSDKVNVISISLYFLNDLNLYDLSFCSFCSKICIVGKY